MDYFTLKKYIHKECLGVLKKKKVINGENGNPSRTQLRNAE